MSVLDEVVKRAVFDPTTDPVELARSHALLRELTGEYLERDLFKAVDGDGVCAAEVRGPTGCGKSSFIMRVLADLTRLAGPPRHEILLLRAGDAEGFLSDTGAFALHLLRVVRVQGVPIRRRGPSATRKRGS
jgi:hypothetical protein